MDLYLKSLRRLRTVPACAARLCQAAAIGLLGLGPGLHVHEEDVVVPMSEGSLRDFGVKARDHALGLWFGKHGLAPCTTKHSGVRCSKASQAGCILRQWAVGAEVAGTQLTLEYTLSTNVLVGDGRKKAQFPVTLIVLAHESTLLRGLPPPPAPKHRRAVVTVPAGAGGAAGAGGGSGAPVAHTPARRTSTATTPAGKGPTGSAKKRANDTPGDDPDPDAPPARRLRGPAALALGAGSAAPSGAGAGAGAPVAPTPARQHSKKRHHTPGADPVHQMW